jgi:putative Mg2+ transporter-C (MgtC) family protein
MDPWWHGMQHDFSDLPQWSNVLQLTMRLTMACLLGGMIGYERQRHGKAAGLRTHMLVAMSAALFVSVPQLGNLPNAELGRVIQGVATGIGFLGAGTILKSVESREIHGLTTATSIWLTTAIGVAAGLGRLASAAVATVLALVVLLVVGGVEKDTHADQGKFKN